MKILGLNAYHGDSAAALVIDGELVAAAEEERFKRIKHWAGFPAESIRYCIQEAGLTLDDLDGIAINQDHRAHLGRRIGYALTSLPGPRLVWDRLRNKRQRMGVLEQLHEAFPGQRFAGRLTPVEHHLAHLYSAYYVSPFAEAVVASVDGFGDFASGAWGVGRGKEIIIEGRVFFPHSLGIFYQAMTQYLGFPGYGDEYKVMGLAPYGEPAFMAQMHELVSLEPDGGYRLNLNYFRHHREKIAFEWQGGAPVFGVLYSDALSDLLGPARGPEDPLTQRHKDIAHSVQAMYEEAFFHLLNRLHQAHSLDAVALAGGCAMNSVANGKVRRHTPFERVYVQAAAGDAGGAVGAAFALSSREDPGRERFHMSHAYWGPSFTDPKRINEVLESRRSELDAAQCRIETMADEDELCRLVASAIAEGKVVGWFQGRMEWGPRALGNRSILCDPRRADMKDILNSKIKRRESFRPFAPSILREAVPEWFEQNDDVPFMMKVLQIRSEKRLLVPAVAHVDGSGRLQTVTRDSNTLYYKLIDTFSRLSDVPLVLNTSFNENEPIVCRPEEALDCFIRTNMDMLVVGQSVIARKLAGP